MLATLLLDPHYGQGDILYLFGSLLAVIVLFIVLMVLWSYRIKQQFERTTAPSSMTTSRLLLLLVLGLLLLAFAGLVSFFIR